MITIYLWIAMALYGIGIQAASLGYARVNFRVASAFANDGVQGIEIMARARLRSNWVRMSIVTLNLFIGFLALITPSQRHPTLLTVIASAIFILNEAGMLLVATLEVRAHRALRRHKRA